MNDIQAEGRSFQGFTKFVVFFSVLLIWWGAATTTKQAGMAFADWPLSFGSINPEGWLSRMVPFLEHSHRLLATLTGLFVLALFSWAYAKSGKRVLEVILLVIMLAVVFGIFIAGGAERSDPVRKQDLLLLGAGLSLIPIAWLIWSWIGRSWRLIEKLTALALLMVTTQAILGGLRVTEISNTFAVIHGCLAQAFFCLLILIVMVAGNGWDAAKYSGPAGLRAGAAVLLVSISVQLILGASMRHFHRYGLADTGLLKTQGEWVPNLGEPIIAVMFFHKATAFMILGIAGMLALYLARKEKKENRRALRHASLIVGLLLGQIALGITVIATGKHFWMTNFHVLNGLAILAVSFVFLVKLWRGGPALAKP